ncbi:hypothetical protein QUH32_25185, partial [Klebsiella pneumoniae]|uniref:hypothetical protein n=1 Tax=Klebsiella pneumoniae TaxID=573 RepID=UPI0025A1E266
FAFFLTADRAEASERPFLQLSSSYANIFVWLSSTIFPWPKTICVTITPYNGIDKNNPRRTCTRHRPSFFISGFTPP